jgi:hypothetical protein
MSASSIACAGDLTEPRGMSDLFIGAAVLLALVALDLLALRYGVDTRDLHDRPRDYWSRLVD